MLKSRVLIAKKSSIERWLTIMWIRSLLKGGMRELEFGCIEVRRNGGFKWDKLIWECKMNTLHKIIIGDSRQMKEVPDESVHLIITSPPYWQLKDYGNGKQIGYNDSYENFEKLPPKENN